MPVGSAKAVLSSSKGPRTKSRYSVEGAMDGQNI
jgi:hypothetical protein